MARQSNHDLHPARCKQPAIYPRLSSAIGILSGVTPYRDARGLDWLLIAGGMVRFHRRSIQAKYAHDFVVVYHARLSRDRIAGVSRCGESQLCASEYRRQKCCQREWDQLCALTLEVGELATFNLMAAQLQQAFCNQNLF